MAETVDMTLDDIIKNNKKSSSYSGGGASSGVGPTRRPFKRARNRQAPYQPPKAPDAEWQHDMYPAVAAGGAGGGRVSALETGTKLYVSKLDFGVSNEDSKNRWSRANWTPEDTKKFCEIYCIQIDLGNCKNGKMTRSGWTDIQKRFRDATGQLHDSEEFGSRVRELKKQRLFIEELRHLSSGLGYREDGSVVASDKWWEDKLVKYKGKQEWLDLKEAWPEYTDELDRMFAGVAVTGETAYVPGASRQLSSSEEETTELGTPQSHTTPQSGATPVSSGSKRTASSNRSTAASLGKKPKNVAVRNMNNNMTRFNSSYDRRTEVIENIWQEKKNTKQQVLQKREQEQKLVVDSATALEVHKMDPKLWNGVVNICRNDDVRHIYLCSPVEARLTMIKSNAEMEIHAEVDAPMDNEDQEDNWWEEFWSMVIEDDDEAPFIFHMYEYATHIDKYDLMQI